MWYFLQHYDIKKFITEIFIYSVFLLYPMKEDIIKAFDDSLLLVKKSTKQSLPLDTVGEWKKGIQLVDALITEILSQSYIEQIEDKNGDFHKKTTYDPLLPTWVRERRLLLDQIYKFSGGEAVNEGKKEVIKNMAKVIFHASMSDEKIKHAEKFKKIIEAEFHEQKN